jgi:hypothetical protein
MGIYNKNWTNFCEPSHTSPIVTFAQSGDLSGLHRPKKNFSLHRHSAPVAMGGAN